MDKQDYIDESRQTKFNADIDYQMKLGEMFWAAAKVSTQGGDIIQRAKILKQCYIMASPVLKGDEHKNINKNISDKISLFYNLLARKNIQFINGDFYFSNGNLANKEFRKKGFRIIGEINSLLDDWDIKLRNDCKVAGLFLLKDKSSADAMDEE